ncbi:hypothetical protein GN958_ATG18883 [Phytophthora infestans]|uniref:Secreted RxLR effector peptide protein n=1 Tax=Phytophthora infestans TaxID=4787 RepID=A0A8S9TTL7_PHYIN|nr:hypothetical protein GN958_ATG18883 [Phytophthora infestans]
MRPSLPVVSVALALLLALVVQVAGASDYQLQQLFNLQRNTTTQWPSLRFTFVLKRSSMKVHGQSEFSLEADPDVLVDEHHVLYDIFATFTKGKAVHKYTFVNGTAYYSTSSVNNVTVSFSIECLDPEFNRLPPINAIVDAINQTTPIISGPSGGGNLFKVTVNDIDFAL